MILTAGTHTLRRDADPDRPFTLKFACASAPIPGEVIVRVNGEVTEHVYVGTYSSHTWWSSNPIFDPEAIAPGDEISIEIATGVVLRIDTDLTLV